MRRDNRGLSLVELMVVIAIIAVLGGIGLMGINAMTGRPAQQCSEKIIYSLERHRVTAMSKVDAYYVLRSDAAAKKIYIDEYVTNNRTGGSFGPYTKTTAEIASSGVKISYVCSDGNTYNLDDVTDASLRLAFDRTTGSFKKQADGSYCTRIIAERGGRKFEVTLVPLTGKVYKD